MKPEWLLGLEKETAVFVYVDLSNVLHWQDTLKWKFRFEDLVSSLQAIASVGEIKIYYGFDTRDPGRSQQIQARLRKAGAIVRSKDVKHIKKSIDENFIVKKKTRSLFNPQAEQKLQELLAEIRGLGVSIEEPKCNFDVELTMDMMDDRKKFSAVLLLSGDSDFAAPLQRIKLEGKKTYVCGVRGQISKELIAEADQYVDFGRLYVGNKYR